MERKEIPASPYIENDLKLAHGEGTIAVVSSIAFLIIFAMVLSVIGHGLKIALEWPLFLWLGAYHLILYFVAVYYNQKEVQNDNIIDFLESKTMAQGIVRIETALDTRPQALGELIGRGFKLESFDSPFSETYHEALAAQFDLSAFWEHFHLDDIKLLTKHSIYATLGNRNRKIKVLFPTVAATKALAQERLDPRFLRFFGNTHTKQNLHYVVEIVNARIAASLPDSSFLLDLNQHLNVPKGQRPALELWGLPLGNAAYLITKIKNQDNEIVLFSGHILEAVDAWKEELRSIYKKLPHLCKRDV